MSVRHPIAGPPGEPSQGLAHSEVSLRLFVCLVAAAALGASVWRFPFHAKPDAYRRRDLRGYRPRHRRA